MDSKKKKKNKKRQVNIWILIVAVIICIVIGLFVIKDSFLKFNRAAGYSERILKFYTK